VKFVTFSIVEWFIAYDNITNCQTIVTVIPDVTLCNYRISKTVSEVLSLCYKVLNVGKKEKKIALLDCMVEKVIYW
jgi:hypothetical protein